MEFFYIARSIANRVNAESQQWLTLQLKLTSQSLLTLKAASREYIEHNSSPNKFQDVVRNLRIINEYTTLIIDGCQRMNFDDPHAKMGDLITSRKKVASLIAQYGAYLKSDQQLVQQREQQAKQVQQYQNMKQQHADMKQQFQGMQQQYGIPVPPDAPLQFPTRPVSTAMPEEETNLIIQQKAMLQEQLESQKRLIELQQMQLEVQKQLLEAAQLPGAIQPVTKQPSLTKQPSFSSLPTTPASPPPVKQTPVDSPFISPEPSPSSSVPTSAISSPQPASTPQPGSTPRVQSMESISSTPMPLSASRTPSTSSKGKPDVIQVAEIESLLDDLLGPSISSPKNNQNPETDSPISSARSSVMEDLPSTRIPSVPGNRLEDVLDSLEQEMRQQLRSHSQTDISLEKHSGQNQQNQQQRPPKKMQSTQRQFHNTLNKSQVKDIDDLTALLKDMLNG